MTWVFVASAANAEPPDSRAIAKAALKIGRMNHRHMSHIVSLVCHRDAVLHKKCLQARPLSDKCPGGTACRTVHTRSHSAGSNTTTRPRSSHDHAYPYTVHS